MQGTLLTEEEQQAVADSIGRCTCGPEGRFTVDPIVVRIGYKFNHPA